MKRNHKSALLLSVLSLVLCLSMLVGTTFAWFTDSVSSDKNTIVAGNLDVTLDYYDEASDSFLPVTEQTKVFDPVALWEPGYTEVAYLRIGNAGSLALKYWLNVNVLGETAGTNVDKQSFKLSDHLVFKVIEIDEATVGTYTRESAQAAAGAELGLKSFNGEAKTLLQGAPADYVALVIYMPDSVGNEANPLADSTPPSIELGVKLLATQAAAEPDGFGPDYDKNAVATDKAYTVAGNATMKDVMDDINAAEDKTVLVQTTEDMTWQTGAGIGSTPLVDENAKVEDLIIDLGGKTLTATGEGVGKLRLANGGTLTVKNGTIKDESVSYAEDSWEYGYLEFGGKLVFEDVKFESAIMVSGESASFKSCSFNSNKSQEYAVWVDGGSASFVSCSFAGPRGIKVHEDYGSEVGSVLVDACTFDNLSEKPGVALGTLNAATSVVIKNSDFINCQKGDQGKYIYESDTDVTTFTFKADENNEVINVATPDLVISTKEELFAFANDVNVNGNGYAGKLVVLGADIDLNNEEWTPIGQTGGNGVATDFKGMFDGKGHTIENLTITNNAYDAGANYAVGLFGFVDMGDAQIVNLTVDGANVNGHHWTGVIAGYLTGSIKNCTVKNATVTCTHANGDACGDKAGVICGYVNSGSVTANTAQDCTVTAGRDAGQIVGMASTAQAYGNTAYNVTVAATGDCTGANIRNEEIGRLS